MYNLIAVILFLAIFIRPLNSQTLEVINEAGNSNILFKVESLEISDDINYFGGKNWDSYENKVTLDADGIAVLNTYGTEADWSFRREIGVLAGGHEVEITIQAYQKAYSNVQGNHFEYVIRMPRVGLEGIRWEAIVGRSKRTAEESGVVDSAASNGGLPVSPCRWINFDLPSGSIVFDFNPEGVTSYSDWGQTLIRGQWIIRVRGDFIEFVFSQSAGITGFTINSKVLIFEGTLADYDARHTEKKYYYYDNFRAAKSFSFGASVPGESFTRVDDTLFSNNAQAGWLDNAPVALGKIADKGGFYGYAEGSEASVFQSVVDPGLYLINVSVASGEDALNPFTISSNGRLVSDDSALPAENLRTYTFSQWLDDGIFRLELGSDWRISAVTLQLIQRRTEDYKVRRSFWRVSDLYEPSTLYSSFDYSGEPDYKVVVQDQPLPVYIDSDIPNAIIQADSEVLLPDQRSPSFAWRTNSTLGSLGTGVLGSFDEFNTPELIARRVAELKERGITAITVDGLHSRLLFSEQLPKVEENMRMLVEECHRNGIKVIDHYSLTLLWNWGNGTRFLVEHPDWLQRSVSENLPNRGICPNNPEFREFYFDYVKDFIAKTDIDGMMIDEIGFQNKSTCACIYCREAFTRDTGLVLPLNETSHLVDHISTNLGKSYLAWRARSIGDFYVEMRREINKVKPEFTLLNYTTHRLFFESECVIANGVSITEAARGSDWLGIEFMTRAPMASHRTNLAFGKLTNSLRMAYDAPIFRLVYTNDYDVAYFCWAQNAMLGQVTWFINPVPESKGRDFSQYKSGMDVNSATPRATVAMFFSTQSRDWAGRGMPHAPDAVGFLQNLGDRNVPAIALIEPSFSPEELSEYPVLILPSASCMSDREVEVALDFVKDGGYLVVTGDTATLDEAGNPRTVWPFASLFGISPEPFKRVRISTIQSGDSVVAAPANMRFAALKNVEHAKGDVVFEATEPNGRTYPVGLAVDYGKGKALYLSGQFGVLNYEPYEQKLGVVPVLSRSAEQDAVMDALLGEVLAGRNFFDFPYSGDRIASTVYTEKTADGEATLVHLLNTAGAGYPSGVIVREVAYGDPFPALEAITFGIATQPIVSAKLTSPDFDGEIKLAWQKRADGTFQIEIPGGTFSSYAIVRLEH